ncbi:MAG: DUF4417 domain-containing protein [Clostridia bacterium]|nr:DUF4417 domain-containing protein [Clostridia bacterium]
MKSTDFRNSNLFLRNEFEGSGIYGFPVIKKQELDLSNIELISCSDISVRDTLNLHKGVHFFVDDFRFNSIYNNPERSLEKYSKYKFLLTPDNSLYSEMDMWRQIESVGHSRWVGAFWQSKGLTVIPTVSWAQPSSFRFCFDSIEKGSIVAVGMIGCKKEKVAFMKGYNVMLKAIEPSAVICFGDPFPEMEGNIIPVNYLSSRKVMRNGR